MSNYPDDFDTNVEIPAVKDNITEIGADSINGLISAIFAIERALGLNPEAAASDLTTRLSQALNDDGTIRAAALAAAGLVTLPIDNSDVGSSAAIVESKLDLDFSTQVLQNQITSNDVDISTLQNQLATEILKLSRHVLGLANRHNSTHIDHALIDGYSIGSGTTLKDAMDFVYGAFLTHRESNFGVEHNASVIKYVPVVGLPGEVVVITATNVQDAIGEFENSFIEDRRKHNDSAHSDGISNDGYVYLSGQGAVNDASARPTLYTTVSPGPEIIKLGLINASTVKSSGFSQNAITSTANSLIVTAKSGTETRSTTLTDIHLGGAQEGVYPAGVGRLSLKGIVDSFNRQLALVRFPITAFNSDDGELVFQHNIAKDDCTITLTNPGSLPAGNELGFGNVLGTEIERKEIYRMVVNGTPFTELLTISDGYLTQGAPSTIVNLGVDVTATGLNLRADQLFNIHSHSDFSGASGTYRITALSGSTSVVLDQSIPAGDFGYIIYEDTPDTSAISSPTAIDIFIDDSRTLEISTRADVTTSQFSGLLSMVEVSQDFPASVGSTLVLTKTGTTYALVLTVGASSGPAANFEEGYIGEVTVIAPDNISYIKMLLVNTLPPTPRTDTITFSANEFQDNKLLLGTTHVRSGAAVIEFPLDKRNVGLVGSESVGSEFFDKVLGKDLANLHLSGVVRGFNVISNTTTSLVLNGGMAYIGGKAVFKTRQTIGITNVASSASTWNLILTKHGTIEIYDEATSGFSLTEAIRFDEFIVLAQIVVSAGPVISTITDARFLINDIESRLDLTVDVREVGAGSFQTLDSAILYSRAAPNDVKPEITVLSDLTVSNAFVLDSGSRIVAYNDLTFSSDLTISAGAKLEVHGILTVVGDVFIQTGGELICNGTSVFSSNIDMGDFTKLYFGDASSLQIIQLSGEFISITGDGSIPLITFAGTGDGIQTTASNGNYIIKNLNMLMTNSTNAILSFADYSYEIKIDNCIFSQLNTLSLAQLTTSRPGIESAAVTIEDVKITNCKFLNLGVGIYAPTGATWIRVTLSGCFFGVSGFGVYFDGVTDLLSTESIYSANHNASIWLRNSSRCIISDSFFTEELDVTSTPNVIDGGTVDDYIIVDSNVFSAHNVTEIITLTDSQGTIVSNNIIAGCTTGTGSGDYAITVSVTGSDKPENSIHGNIIHTHTGNAISCTYTNVSGNVVFATGNASQAVFTMGQGGNDEARVCSANAMTFSNATTTMAITTTSLAGNFFKVGSIIVSQQSLPMVVSGNNFNLTSTSATHGLEINDLNSGSGNVLSIFTGNHVKSEAVTSTLYLNNNKVSIVGNSILGANTDRAITVGNASTSSVRYFAINDNLIIAGAAYGIYVDATNTMIEGNFISGAVSAGEIFVTSGKINILISNNFSNTSSTGANLITHADASPTSVFVGFNKNAQSYFTYSAINALQTGTWTKFLTTSTVELRSSTTDDKLAVPLIGLPVGARLESVALLVDTPGGAGDVVIQLLRRQATSGTGVTAISAVDSNSAGIYQTMSVTPTSTEYIGRNLEYLLYIESNSSGNKIGQVVVTIRY